ncbi:MAG: histidinol-phosphate transaminase [Alkalispirochaeta sp.]
MKTRGAIESLHTYVPGERRANTIKLASNENPHGCSPVVERAVAEAARELHIYPDGAARDLVDRIAFRFHLDPDWIVTGNGSDEVLTLIAGTYIEAGDRVLIAKHTFSEYEFATRLYGGGIVTVPMPDLEIHPLDYLEYIDGRTKIVFLCSPNNPTGGAFSQRELEEFLAAVPSEVLVVVDHAYIEYQNDPEASRADTLVARYPNLIVLHTFSKIYGIAAVRLGFGIARPERIAEIKRVRPPFSVNGVAQAAGIAALSDEDFVNRSLESNRRGLARMQALCDELGLRYLPTQANFITVEVPTDARDAAEYIARRGITVRALNSFNLPEYLRITIGTSSELDRLESILRQFVTDHPPTPVP